MTIVMNEVTMSKALTKKKPVGRVRGGERTIAAGEFKAKCLRIMDEVKETGVSLVVTKRGQPVMRVVPITNGKNKKKKDSIFGRLVGVMEIVGDPDDLIKPVFALEDYDMLK
jgi:prevent-host-death family protein